MHGRLVLLADLGWGMSIISSTAGAATSFALAFVIVLSGASVVRAGPPEVVRLHGILSELQGAPVADGQYTFRVEILDAAVGGSVVYSQDVPVTVAGSAYSLVLSPSTPGELNGAFAGSPRFIETTVLDGPQGAIGETLLPREEVGSVPYALVSSAETQAAFTTGDLKLSLKQQADPGWILLDDGSIGNADSNATTLADPAAHGLFVHLWENVPEQWVPMQDAAGGSVGRGGTAEEDWADNRRLLLPLALGRVLGVSGAGAALSVRELGENLGEEAHELAIEEMPEHSHGFVFDEAPEFGDDPYPVLDSDGSDAVHTLDTLAEGNTQPHNNMQPTLFVNVMIKL